jgi:phosphatidate cytidylyltransferase
MNGLPPTITLTIATWTFWGAGCVLLAFLSLWPATRERARPLWSLMLSEALIIAAVSLPLLLGRLAAFPALLICAWRLGWENGEVNARRVKASEETADRVRWLAGTVTVVLAAIWMWLGPSGIGLLLALALSAAAIIATYRSNPAVMAVTTVILYPGLPLGALAIAMSDPTRYPALLLAFLYVELLDSLSLLGGRLAGRTIIFPWLSPRKTLEGLITGAAGLLIASAALNVTVLHLPWSVCLAITLATAIAAVAGDLAASLPKRLAGVKDYPPVLSGHGGLQDIIDAWMVAGPIVCVVEWLLGS